jgi:hypothetical protein
MFVGETFIGEKYFGHTFHTERYDSMTAYPKLSNIPNEFCTLWQKSKIENQLEKSNSFVQCHVLLTLHFRV